MDESLSAHLHETYETELKEEKLLTRAQKKNARKKQKRKEKTTEPAFEIEEVTESLEQVSIAAETATSGTDVGKISDEKPSTRESNSISTPSVTETEPSVDRDGLKRIRALRKKLKQIEELESRIASGDIKKPDQDQLNKIAKKEDLVEELSQLTGE